MRKLLKLMAIATAGLAISTGAAQAQTVSGIGMAGMDPRSGNEPKQIVIFFHGYTQRGVAMKALADTLAKRLPDAAFIFNDGPLQAGDGRAWYVLRGEDPENTKDAVTKLAVDTVTRASEGLGVPRDRIVVVGFSQGGGVAFDAGACSSPDVKAVVSLAGVLANTCEREAGEAAANVLIVHNDGDPVVGAARIAQFRVALSAAGYDSQLETARGNAHWPSGEGLNKAKDFIVAQLGGK